MISEESTTCSMRRKTVKVSDQAIVWGMYSAPYKKKLLQSSWEEFVAWVLWLVIRFNKATIALQMWSVLRFKPGSQTIGLLSFTWALSFVIGFNSTEIHWLLKPLSALITPFLIIGKSWDWIYELIFVSCESKFLMIYTILFGISGLVHIIILWVGIDSMSSMSQRGQSWIGLGLSYLIPVNEFVICGIIEPLIVIGLGVCAWHYYDDVYFGIYMISIALAEGSQQILDKAYHEHTKSILKV